jgi:hypothetical protein
MTDTQFSPAVAPVVGQQILDRVQSDTIQKRGAEKTGLFALIPRMGVQTGLYIPPWWSPMRDQELRKFWKRSDHLAGAVYTMEARMTAITKKVVPLDPSNRVHLMQAELMSEILDQTPEYGEGWTTFYTKFVEELLTQDNGVFVEIIGDGPTDGPIIGMPLSISVLDANHCQRTGNVNYPVIFTDENGLRHKLHRSRVMFTSQMPSPDYSMLGVGFCACSRVINVAQTLLDILIYKQEKMGSRPHQALLLTKGGLDPHDVEMAFAAAESTMDSQGLSRFSKIVLTGSSTIMDADIKEVTFNGMPEGFDEFNSITLGIAAIALGFGVDARELFPALGGGATRADAMLSHLKQRGKSPGQIIDLTEKLFNQKFLPPHLKLTFDFQDDAQDRQSAEIGKIRQEKWNYAMTNGSLNIRTIREQMLSAGDLDRSQFERIELEDGRLPDGTDILNLFYSEDKNLRKYLQLGVDNPCDYLNNDSDEMQNKITDKKQVASTDMINATNEVDKWWPKISLYALDALDKLYQPIVKAEADAELALDQQALDEATASAKKPLSDQRSRTVNPGSPKDSTVSPSSKDSTTSSSDNEGKRGNP